MENTINKRIKDVFASKGYSVLKLATEYGVAQSTLNAQISGKSAMAASTIVLVLSAFPDVSAEWLLRGTGSMVIQQKPQPEQHKYEINYGHKVEGNNNITGNSAPVYAGDNCTIQTDSSRINELQQENDRLNVEINKLREDNRTLAMSNAALTAKLLPLI